KQAEAMKQEILKALASIGAGGASNASGSGGAGNAPSAGTGECPTPPEKASKEEIEKALALLTSGPGQTGGGTFTGTGPKVNNTFTGLKPPPLKTGLDDLVREAAEQFNSRSDEECYYCC